MGDLEFSLGMSMLHFTKTLPQEFLLGILYLDIHDVEARDLLSWMSEFIGDELAWGLLWLPRDANLYACFFRMIMQANILKHGLD